MNSFDSIHTESSTVRNSYQFKNNYSTEMCSGSKEGSYFRRIDFCIFNSRLESNKEEKKMSPICCFATWSCANHSKVTTLETTLGQMAPPKIVDLFQVAF